MNLPIIKIQNLITINSVVNESNIEKKKTKNADQDGGDEAIPIDGGDEAIPVDRHGQHQEEVELYITCDLCILADEHVCRMCSKPVCNFCTLQDPSSENEMHRVHKKGDIRCIPMGYECPMCLQMFKAPEEMQTHIDDQHEQEVSLSLLSEASSGWMNATSSSSSAVSISEESIDDLLNEHENELKKQIERQGTAEIETGKRIKQNLKNINFEEDSDEEQEWAPTNAENEMEVEAEDKSSKRKRNTVKYIQNKKKMTNVTNILICDVCECKFTRKDNLKRHKINKH